MARPFSKAFYNSQEWKDCRTSYVLRMPVAKRGLCEQCYKEGKHTFGKELHHKIPLSPHNMNDRKITLGHDNLILLCFECHQRAHGKRSDDRQYIVDEYGNIIPKK